MPYSSVHGHHLLSPCSACDSLQIFCLTCRLGWIPASLAIALFTLLSMYSGALISRLSRAAGGALLFGDIGEAAAGNKVRLFPLPVARSK